MNTRAAPRTDRLPLEVLLSAVERGVGCARCARALAQADDAGRDGRRAFCPRCAVALDVARAVPLLARGAS